MFSLLTALAVAMYLRRRPARRAGGPDRSYLVTGLTLTAVVTALPLLAWPVPDREWYWLMMQWYDGTAALLAVAAGCWLLARHARSRALAACSLAYTATVILVNWPVVLTAVPAFTHGDMALTLMTIGQQPLFGWSARLLPALVLLVGAALALAVRRTPGSPRPAGPVQP